MAKGEMAKGEKGDMAKGDIINLMLKNNKTAFDRVYDIVAKIPCGKVMTYKQVSILANVPTPRIVGFALHVNKDPINIPCHRVIYSSGELTKGYVFGGETKQREKLQKEGVFFLQNGLVNLDKSQF